MIRARQLHRSVATIVASLAAFLALAGAPPRANVPLRAPAVAAVAVPAVAAVAVIVHPDNPVANLAFDDLKTILKLDRQFWDDKTRVVLLARPSDTKEQGALLKDVYALEEKELRKYWVGKLFAGKIAAIPTVVKTSAAAGRLVRQSAGAISVVLAADVPDGVKVLTIDGKKPGDAGYPLTVKD
jgi:hypothetical protein